MNRFFLLALTFLCSNGFSVKKLDPIDVVQDGLIHVSDIVEDVVSEVPPLSGVFKNCVKPELECPNINVTFWYRSRSQSNNTVELKVSDPKSFNSISKNENPWKIIIHGYTKSKNEIPNPQLISAYFERGEYNLLSVDYAPIARDKCYIQAVHNVPLIANCTAQMIDALMDKGMLAPEKLHVIGFSLGAQVAGNIHNFMKHNKPKRVTGLDPAGPLFDGNVNHLISEESGEFVDVVHTNALANGKLKPLGHIDFYANGGFNQPGCVSHNNGSIRKCSHDRAPIYFAESINSQVGFWGLPCNSYVKFYAGACNTNESELVRMGEDVPLTKKGHYYFETKSEAPFAVGKETKISFKNKLHL